MRTLLRTVAAMHVVLILPAALFLGSVLVGVGEPPQYELAHVAQRIVAWYSGQGWTLWLLLLALPSAALVSGCATMMRSWEHEIELPQATRVSLSMLPAPLSTLLVAGTTLASAGILTVVVLHMLAN